MCCGVCCKEFKGWCRAFTRTERALTIIEAVLFVVLIVFLIFLILHLLACSTFERKHEAPEKEIDDTEDIDYIEVETPVKPTKLTTVPHKTIMTKATNTAETYRTKTAKHKTIDPNMECSWTPSAKTTSLTRYFEQGVTQTNKVEPFEGILTTRLTKSTTTTEHHTKAYTKSGYNADFLEEDQSDGEEADPVQNEYILSLVKLKPPKGVVFGCILTIIDKFFMLTSASCIEAIEEVDSLDSFVIIEDYGTSSNGKVRSLSDLHIHPFYQGVNRSYDLALVRSAARLPARAAALPAPLDLALLAIGERLHILGFGPYRSSDARLGRRLRRAPVYRLPAQQCAGAALRHLEAGRAAGGGAAAGGAGGGPAPLCAGALYARGLACQYCGGAPLVRGARLLAVLGDNPQCGAACEPLLYVDVAACRGWIDSVVNAE